MKILGLLTIVSLLALSGCLAERSNDVRSYYKKLGRKQEVTATIDACEECKAVVGDLKAALSDPAKLDRIKFVLKLICDYLGGERAQECKNMVDNLDMLIHQLQPFLDNPEQLCTELKLCGQETVPATSQLGLVFMRTFVRNVNSLKNNDILCEECEFVVTELRDLISQQSIQQKLKQEIEQICKILHSLEQQCDDFVEQNFNLLIQTVEQMLSDPKGFCTQLRLCSGFSVEPMKQYKASLNHVVPRQFRLGRRPLTSLRQFAFLIPRIQTSTGESASCLVCDVGLTKLVAALSEPDVTNQVAMKMSKVLCAFLPDDFLTNCLDFTKAYALSLIRATLNQLNPDEICLTMGFCTNSSIAVIDAMDFDDRSEATCEACRVFTEFLSYECKQQNFQQEILLFLKSEVCTMLPGDYSRQCSDDADIYVPNALNFVADFVNRPEFCTEVSLC